MAKTEIMGPRLYWTVNKLSPLKVTDELHACLGKN